MDSAWAAIRPVVLPRAERRRRPRPPPLAQPARLCGGDAGAHEGACGDNVESVRNVFSCDSILAWHFRSFAAKRSQMLAWEADPDVPPVLRLRTAAEVDQWLAAVGPKG